MRKKDSPHSYEYITPGVWRCIIDLYLSGVRSAVIAKQTGRNVNAIKTVINKTLRNYDDEREAPLAKLERAPSSLSPKRTPTGKEIKFIKELIGYGRTVQEISEVCNIPVSRLLRLRDGFFLLFPKVQ